MENTNDINRLQTTSLSLLYTCRRFFCGPDAAKEAAELSRVAASRSHDMRSGSRLASGGHGHMFAGAGSSPARAYLTSKPASVIACGRRRGWFYYRGMVKWLTRLAHNQVIAGSSPARGYSEWYASSCRFMGVLLAGGDYL